MITVVTLSSLAFVKKSVIPEDIRANDELIFKRMLSSAQEGDSSSELQIGNYYAEGEKVIRDEVKAAEWYKKAALHDNTQGQYQYGNVLLKGIGVLQNYKEAVLWIEKAARKGNKNAQYSMGDIYRYKTGVEADPRHAYMWFSLAAGQGLKEAITARDSMEKLLSQSEIAAAQEEARKMHEGG